MMPIVEIVQPRRTDPHHCPLDGTPFQVFGGRHYCSTCADRFLGKDLAELQPVLEGLDWIIAQGRVNT